MKKVLLTESEYRKVCSILNESPMMELDDEEAELINSRRKNNSNKVKFKSLLSTFVDDLYDYCKEYDIFVSPEDSKLNEISVLLNDSYVGGIYEGKVELSNDLDEYIDAIGDNVVRICYNSILWDYGFPFKGKPVFHNEDIMECTFKNFEELEKAYREIC